MSYDYKSDIGIHIEAFLKSITDYHDYQRVVKEMMQLDVFCICTSHSTGILDKELVDSFISVNAVNNKPTNRRSCYVRKLAYFIIESGEYAYILPRFRTDSKLKTEITYQSCLAHWIYSLVSYKQALGFKYCSEKQFLHQFDTYLVEQGYSGDKLTREMVEGYSKRPDSESPSTIANKISAVRMLGKYIIKNGGSAYIKETQTHRLPKARIPALYDNESLNSLLLTADTYQYMSPWMKYVIPVYFRLLYLTGIRESEGCCIECHDVDYEKYRILIRGAKNQKDRYVYISDFCCNMIRRFDGLMERYKPGRKYLFSSTGNIEDHISSSYVMQLFSDLRRLSGIPASLTVHSLRHTYVIDKITEWENEGINVNAMFPYLSKQLGHATIEETYYYCQRLDCRFKDILKLATASSSIVPEVEDEE